MNQMINKLMLFVLTSAVILLSAGSPHARDLYLGGFVEGLWGAGVDDQNPTDKDYTASETRLQLRAESYGDNAEVFAKVDFVYDGLDSAKYDVQLREAYLKFRLPIDMDFKIGRQILTWGTGDLIFINDVFAKDYQSFLIGRQDEYLKAPQTAMRAEWYTGIGEFSLVAISKFEPNILPNGNRLSFYNPLMGEIVGSDGYIPPTEPEAKFENAEIAFRYAKSVKSFKLAGYAYRGFFKEPRGAKIHGPEDVELFYPRLNVYGASLRGQVGGGILWVEGGYYDSREDSNGENYFVENSSTRVMAGFERQVASDFTGNLQFLVEQMSNYDNYEKSYDDLIAGGMLPPDTPKLDKTRTLLTTRWTKLLASQTVNLSLFAFYSPSDEDAYVRFSAAYKYTDELSLMAGGNIFAGKYDHTMFGQFDHNDNLYVKVNYGF
jgi:hypothetical protein